ncbi:MAG: phosphopantothenoylcysteine decarboxylase, partial [Proteobacteria bacterium]|nr:phosphopantothenoylcysteine decarboxylase [Pseudomonadota bacterium]
SGSIACYKAAELTSRLTQAGRNVNVVMTKHATEFVAPLTFQTLSRNPVTTGIFDEKEAWHPGHIALADSADLFLIAPATANTIAKLACGIADDALTSIALASQAPLLIAPAMNGKMWMHAATQENVARLKSRGAHFIGPEEGLLACGYEGIGRLWETIGILEEAEKILCAQ